MIDLSAELQEQRRDRYLALSREANFPRFTAAGEWRGPGGTPSSRERMWHCLAFLGGEPHMVELANRIVETNADDSGDFTLYTCLLLLKLHEDRLTPAARELLESRISAYVEHSSDHLYRYTENCAALNAWGLFEVARRRGETRYADRAAEWLEDLWLQRRRDGVSEEFLSVNYAPVYMTGIASLARWVEDPVCRNLAEQVEARLWLELASAWHPELQFSAGASGRSYTYCSMSYAPALNGLVWIALGPEASPAPMDLGVFSGDRGLFDVGDQPFIEGGINIWNAAVPFQVPPEAAELFAAKPYPWAMSGSVHLPGYRENELAPPGTDVTALGGWWAEPGRGYLPGTILHPGGRAVLSTYLTEDWGLGASSRILFSQCDFCHAIWRREVPAAAASSLETLLARRTLYTRYVVNDQVEEKLGGNRLDLVAEQGRGGCLQSGPLAVAWYNGGDVPTTGVSRLRTCALIPEHFSRLDEVWLGDQPLADLTGSSEEEEWVFLRDGITYLGLRPLRLTNHGRGPVVSVERVGQFRVVSFANYQGEPRDFLGAELRQTCGGLALCIGSEREWGDFEAFRTACRPLELSDTRYESQRRLVCRWGEWEADVLWDMQTEEIKRATRNGIPLDEPFLQYGPA
ncbi:MAG TPA: hypothetical protein VGM19_00980 [Armatimonadota bacterium]|jgi:hypothetical protein